MIWWILSLAVVSILSYLSDVGIFAFMQDLRVPFFNASICSILILLCMLGVLVRSLHMAKIGEKEFLRKKIDETEKQLKVFQEKEK